MPPTTAQERATDAAKRYLSNIVVIDDEMNMGEGNTAGNGHRLNVNLLSKIFAEVDFSCGIYKPSGQRDEAKVIARQIRKSDAAVLDWKLTGEAGGIEAAHPQGEPEGQEPGALCTEILRTVLKDDREQGQPVRLIIIYTAERISETEVEELKTALPDFQLEALSPGEFGLKTLNTKIVFRGKQSPGVAVQPFDNFTLRIEDLPEYIIGQYAQMADGLLPPAVLHGLAALREKTGKLLGIFNKDLDPAMVLHAMLIPNTSDASYFLCGLLIDECRSIIEDCEKIHASLSVDNLTAWLQQKQEYVAHDNTGGKYPSEKFVEFLGPHTKAHANELKEKSKLFLKIIYADKLWWEKARLFCRLSTMKREHWSATRKLSEGFVPTMNLGSIVRTKEGQFYLCLMPRCDAARVEPSQHFPFTTLNMVKSENEKFSYTLEDDTTDDNLLSAPTNGSWKRMVTFQFTPSPGETKVMASIESGVFFFTDVHGKKFEWVADLKDHLAIKMATDLAPGFSRVGVNEFDWLRRKVNG